MTDLAAGEFNVALSFAQVVYKGFSSIRRSLITRGYGDCQFSNRVSAAVE